MRYAILSLFIASALLTGCSDSAAPPSAPAPPSSTASPPAKPVAQTITLATTTSARDTGLLDHLIPIFRKQTGIDVKVVAVGSGQAMEIARRGDADVLLAHSPAAEEKFVADGEGIERRPLMHNDFILVGPPADPAHIKGEKSVAKAFQEMAQYKTPFVSRADQSGTHKKEEEIWRGAKVEPRGTWYVQSGTGMAQTLHMAAEMKAYTLSDRGTYLSQNLQKDLKIVSEGDPLLLNRYSVTLINPQKHPNVKQDAARQFSDFMVSPATQKEIANFGVEKFGQSLFTPDAKK